MSIWVVHRLFSISSFSRRYRNSSSTLGNDLVDLFFTLIQKPSLSTFIYHFVRPSPAPYRQGLYLCRCEAWQQYNYQYRQDSRHNQYWCFLCFLIWWHDDWGINYAFLIHYALSLSSLAPCFVESDWILRLYLIQACLRYCQFSHESTLDKELCEALERMRVLAAAEKAQRDQVKLNKRYVSAVCKSLACSCSSSVSCRRSHNVGSFLTDRYGLQAIYQKRKKTFEKPVSNEPLHLASEEVLTLF